MTTLLRPHQIHAWLYPGFPCTHPEINYRNTKRPIDVLHPQYFKLLPNGHLSLTSEEKTNYKDTQNGFSLANIDDIKAHSSEQLVTVSGGYNGTRALFQNLHGEYNACIDTLISFVIKHNLTGIDIDFEIYPSWPTRLFNSFVGFITDLGNALHAHGKKLSFCAPSWDEPFGANPRKFTLTAFRNLPVDYIMLMVYDAQDLPDRALGTGVCPISWLRRFVNYSLTQLPSSNKIIVGIPSYGYHFDGRRSKRRVITYGQALEIHSLDSIYSAKRDPDSMELIIESGANGDVTVISDQVSVQAKIKALVDMPMGGIVVWHLGGGNPWFQNEIEETVLMMSY